MCHRRRTLSALTLLGLGYLGSPAGSGGYSKALARVSAVTVDPAVSPGPASDS